MASRNRRMLLTCFFVTEINRRVCAITYPIKTLRGKSDGIETDKQWSKRHHLSCTTKFRITECAHLVVVTKALRAICSEAERCLAQRGLACRLNRQAKRDDGDQSRLRPLEEGGYERPHPSSLSRNDTTERGRQTGQTEKEATH